MRLVEGEIRPRNITTLEAVHTQTEDVSMPFPLKLGASLVPDRFRRKVAELAGVTV